MKKLILGALLMSALFLFGCNTVTPGPTEPKQDGFYGNYQLEEVVYISPLSSASKEYLEKLLDNAVYTISEDEFTIRFDEKVVEIPNPAYLSEPVDVSDMPFMEEVDPGFGDKVLEQYTVQTGADPAYYKLYITADGLYLANYTISSTNDEISFIQVDKLVR